MSKLEGQGLVTKKNPTVGYPRCPVLQNLQVKMNTIKNVSWMSKMQETKNYTPEN